MFFIYFFSKDSQTNRTLTLVSKTIQSLGNLVCSRSNFKEEYMSSMYQSVYTEQHVTAVRQVNYLLKIIFYIILTLYVYSF